MFYTYVLESQLNGTYYIGSTKNLEDRIKRHNQGREKYTKKFRPYKLIFKKEFDTRSNAYRFERKLKSFKNRIYLKQYLEYIAGS